MILSCDSHRYFRRYAGDCMNVAECLEKKLMPMAELVSKNKYLLTMRDSFAMLMLSGNKISVQTLDLNKEFSCISAQLDQIVEDQFGIEK